MISSTNPTTSPITALGLSSAPVVSLRFMPTPPQMIARIARPQDSSRAIGGSHPHWYRLLTARSWLPIRTHESNNSSYLPVAKLSTSSTSAGVRGARARAHPVPLVPLSKKFVRGYRQEMKAKMTGRQRALLFWIFLAAAAVAVGVTSLVFLEDIGVKVAFVIAVALGLGLSIVQIRAKWKSDRGA